MNGEGNRYSTPFEDIAPIKFASRCQRARELTFIHLNHAMREMSSDSDAGPSWANQCQGKKSYPNRPTAVESIRRRRDHVVRTGGDVAVLSGIHPYHCEICGKWHNGHKPGSAEKIRLVREKRRMK